MLYSLRHYKAKMLKYCTFTLCSNGLKKGLEKRTVVIRLIRIDQESQWAASPLRNSRYIYHIQLGMQKSEQIRHASGVFRFQ